MMTSTKKTVLVNYFTSSPNALTGISSYTFSIIHALAKRNNFRIVLATNWEKSRLPSFFEELGIQVETAWVPKSIKMQVPYSWFVARTLAKKHRADLIFSPHPYGAALGSASRVLVVHDLYPEVLPHLYRWDRRLNWKILFGCAAYRSRKIICVSKATMMDVTKWHPRLAARTVVVHEAPVNEVKKFDAALIDHRRYGLVVANATPNKNFDCIMQALSYSEGEVDQPLLLWVGRDDAQITKSKAFALPGANRLIQLGSVDAEKLAALYKGALFYLNASFVEGFCIPVLEAQQYGTPVLCSDIPVLREVASDGAVYFDPHDASSLAEGMKRLWSDENERNRLSQAGNANVAKFSWDRAAFETERVFSDALNG